MSLNVVDIEYAYPMAEPGVMAVQEASFSVDPGELLLVVGTTGSGKSTLLRVAAGLASPSSGSVHIDGEILTSNTAPGRVGMVFQNAESQLFADTLLDDVAFGPKNMGMSSQDALAQAGRALEAVGLDPEEFGARSPFSLSGGEARRAAIAGIVAMQPRYLFFDEPTAGLDASGRSMLRDLIMHLRETSGIVVVSHAIEEFLGIAESALIMRDGRVAWQGPATTLIEDPHPLSHAGVEPPPLLEVWEAARAAGLQTGRPSMDPVATAHALMRAARWS